MYAGRRYYFCSTACEQTFLAAPQRYIGTPGPEDPHAAAVTGDDTVTYTCPMHPEVRQPGPGSCPRCGMALEPVITAAPVIRTKV
jgi:Cu+-exporting ATPase